VRARAPSAGRTFGMSVVRVNAITVPKERAAELEERFAARAGMVAKSPGFEAFELLRPTDDRDVYLVYTRWRSQEDFDNWVSMTNGTADKCPVGCNDYAGGPNHWDTPVTVVQPGTTYKITQASLFAPPFDGNAYHPWPDFQVPFQYNNGDIPKEEKDLRSLYSGTGCWQEKRTFSSNPDLDNLGGDSLMFEVRIRPQTTAISRANGFTMCISTLLDVRPNFRVWSSGSPTAVLDPDNINGDMNARCAKVRTPPAGFYIDYGDNSRYFTVLDYVKTTSRIRSPWVRVIPANTITPDYFPVILSPPITVQPAGTSVSFEFEGAAGAAGSGGTGFSPNIDLSDDKPNIAFRATLVGNTSSLLLPNFDTVAIPYLRPFGS